VISINIKGGSQMKVRPLYDRILIKRLDSEEKTKGGIIIPDTAKEKPQEGKVIAVGKGKLLDDGSTKALDVQVGDKVLFSKYGGTDINIDGEDYLILREEEILAIIEG
jgi:chaperonin GroES